MSLSDRVGLGVGLLIFLGMLVCIGYGFYLERYKKEDLAFHLRNCHPDLIRSHFRYGGIKSRMLWVCMVAGIFLFPRFNVRIGVANKDDLDNFPKNLKFKLLVWCWGLIGFFAALVIYGTLIKVGVLERHPA
jgi:hypothetical protein